MNCLARRGRPGHTEGETAGVTLRPCPFANTAKPMQVRAGETIGNGWGSICRSPE